MKYLEVYHRINDYSPVMQGVFSLSDIKNLLKENHPVLLYKHMAQLEEQGVLSRFIRGFYVARQFNIEVLCQRVCPQSYISCGNVLAKYLMIGSVPRKTILAVKTGKNRVYQSLVGTLVYVGIAPHLFFGFETKEGISLADKEKAFLDTLYFYQRGHKYSFNIFQDINVKKLDMKKIHNYLQSYKNPRFIEFVKGVLCDRN